MRLPFLAFFASVTGLLAQTPLAPLPPDGFVTVAQIVSDFASQPDAATQKYQGQSLLIYGMVSSVHQGDDNASNPLAVILQAPGQTTPDVRCVFSAAGIPEYGQDAQVQISDDHSQATIYHRNGVGTLNGSAPFISAGRNIGIRGTFNKFVVGDIHIHDCTKVSPAHLKKALRDNHIPTD